MGSVPQTYNVPLTPEQINYAESAQWLALARQTAIDVRVATPAFLVSDMSAQQQTVEVQIALQERVRPPQGAAQWWDVPPVFNVPLILPRGGGFALTLPLKKGDEGLLVFCDTCFDLWWQNGQTKAPKAANVAAPSGSQIQLEVRRHHFWDCGFIPGMTSQPNVLSAWSATSAQLRTYDGTSGVVDVSDAGVKLTGHGATIDVTNTGVALIGPQVTVSNGGAVQSLITDAFYQYWVTSILPFLQGLGYTGPTPPTNSETTILKGQ